MPQPSKIITCDIHGDQEETFVCQHIVYSLVNENRVGFHYPAESDILRPDAWCAECENTRIEAGGDWNDELNERLNVKLLCGKCYDIAKSINSKLMNKPIGNSVVIQDKNGKYLMQFRDNNSKNNPLTWEFFGGVSKGDETVLEATVRELKEELGINVTEEELEVITKETIEGIDEALLRYKKPIEWGEFKLNEGAGCAYLTKDELLKVVTISRVKHYVENYL